MVYDSFSFKLDKKLQPIIGAKETAFLQDLISSKLFLNPFPVGAARSIF